MPISVGHDTAKTLTVGDQSIAYYSIPAATEAGLGDFSKLPAAVKVVLKTCYALKMTRRLQSTTSKHSLNGVLKAAKSTRNRIPPCPRAFARLYRCSSRSRPSRDARRTCVPWW